MIPEDIHHMRHALSLARRGLGRVAPNPSVGCVLVKGGHVIAAARTGDGGRPHAETLAIEMAGSEARGATAYVTLEPCAHHGQTPPCVDALAKAGIKRAVVACIDPDPRVSGKGIEILKEAGIETVTGVLEEEARALNAGFFQRIQEGRPLVTLKVAATSDNKIAPLSGERTWISGPLARCYTHLERAGHDAILVGIGTVLKDNPQLTTRLEGSAHKIIRVILDTELKIPLQSRLVLSAGETPLWIFYKDGLQDKKTALETAGAKLFQTDPHNLEAVLKELAAQGITRLFVEGGAKVHAAFAQARFGDRLLWLRSQAAMGEGLAAFNGMKKDEILKLLSLEPSGTRVLGEDLLEIYGKQA